MSFDLTVLALGPAGDEQRARAMLDSDPAADTDPRIAAFHQDLRQRFPESGDDTPWASPLEARTDRIGLYLRHGEAGDAAIEAIEELTAEYGLAVYDPQNDAVHLP